MELFLKIRRYLRRLRNLRKETWYYPLREKIRGKLDKKDEQARKFIDKWLLGKYFKIGVYYLIPKVNRLFKWLFIVMLNGFLLYIAYLGLFNPVHWIQTILALGLAVWIPSVLIKKMYNRISKDKLERVKASPYMLPPIR